MRRGAASAASRCVGIRGNLLYVSVDSSPFLCAEEDAEAQERDQLRYDRHKERERQRRLARAHPDKRSKLDREKDRDVTEKIALGMPSKTVTQESVFDQRLFNQSQVRNILEIVHYAVVRNVTPEKAGHLLIRTLYCVHL